METEQYCTALCEAFMTGVRTSRPAVQHDVLYGRHTLAPGPTVGILHVLSVQSSCHFSDSDITALSNLFKRFTVS